MRKAAHAQFKKVQKNNRTEGPYAVDQIVPQMILDLLGVKRRSEVISEIHQAVGRDAVTRVHETLQGAAASPKFVAELLDLVTRWAGPGRRIGSGG